jgi:stage II sporulation protein P
MYKFAYLEKRDDVPLSEVIFKQTLKESMEIYSPSIIYFMAQKETTYQRDDTSIEASKETSIEASVEAAIETSNQASIEIENVNEDNIYSKVLEENISYTDTSFVEASEPVAVYLEEQLKNPTFVKQTFYSEDATTYISESQLSYDKLVGFDATIKQTSDKPQILIYHTHSQEAYADSKEGEMSESIVGVGERLATILGEQYGFNVIHHLGQYDIESRDYAYSKAMEGISTLLENNPSIEVIIDLHRDETNADTKLVTTIQDKQMAKFMFFNGLCYTRELGELANLSNPYIQENLSFSFQMQLFADEYYPGLTRRIYLKGYRYNMHFRPKSLLIELGSQTNTLEEAMNSCEPMAHIIASVLNGNNKE